MSCQSGASANRPSCSVRPIRKRRLGVMRRSLGWRTSPGPGEATPPDATGGTAQAFARSRHLGPFNEHPSIYGSGRTVVVVKGWGALRPRRRPVERPVESAPDTVQTERSKAVLADRRGTGSSHATQHGPPRRSRVRGAPGANTLSLREIGRGPFDRALPWHSGGPSWLPGLGSTQTRQVPSGPAPLRHGDAACVGQGNPPKYPPV